MGRTYLSTRRRRHADWNNIVSRLGEGREQRTHLDGSLDSLNLDSCRLVQSVNLHVDDLSRLSVYSVLVLSRRMLCLLSRVSTKLKNSVGG